MLRKLLIILSIVAAFVIVINVPYVYEEYNEDNLIIQNKTGWDREIFSDYKKFELKNYRDHKIFIIPYKLDVNIINAEFIRDWGIPYYIHITFDKLPNKKTMDIMLPKFFEPKDSDVIIQSFVYDESIMTLHKNSIPPELLFPLIKVKDYNTHIHYLLQLHNDTKNNLESTSTISLVALPKNERFYYGDENPAHSYWNKEIFRNFDFFPLLSQQIYHVREDNFQCPKDFELVLASDVLNLDISKCIKSKSLLKWIENEWQ